MSAAPAVQKSTSSLSERKAGAQRDLVLDFLRGLAVFSMVTDHLLFVSGFSYLTRERVGVVTGAEFFVLISGVLIGHIYRQKIAKYGFKPPAVALLKRAFQLYWVCVAIVVGVFLFSLIPSVNTKLYTPWGMYNLYDAVQLVGWWKVLTHSLLLKCGPLRMNVIGIYVVLMAAAPIAMWFLTKSQTKLLLLLSGLAWLINLKFQFRMSTTVFDSVFRVLSWQFLFVIGMAAGYHRQYIRESLYSSRGRVLLVALGVLSVVFCIFAIHNPRMDLAESARLHWISEDTFNQIYERYFTRKTVAPGRLLNVLALFTVGYMCLQRFWTNANKWFGWFFVTIGQASLYVYILHVFILQGVYQLPWFNQNNILINTFATASVLLLLWGMTKRRILFWLIPR